MTTHRPNPPRADPHLRLWPLHGVERLSEKIARVPAWRREAMTRSELVDYLQGVEPFADAVQWQWRRHR